MESNNKEMTILVVVIIALALLWVGHNFLSKIQAAPITLVPQGSQSAFNNGSYQMANNALLMQGRPDQYNSGNKITTGQSYNTGQINNGMPTNYNDVALRNQELYLGFGDMLGGFAGTEF